eukprot:6250046-Ditylum_brightwellii.AAC.1
MMSFWTSEMVCVNGLLYKKKPWNHDALHPYFRWNPVKMIKHTMAVTTQLCPSPTFQPPHPGPTY